MKANFRTVLALCLVIAGCTGNTTNAQSENVSTGERVGGQCEGCEAIYENRTLFKDLGWEISLPGYDQKGQNEHNHTWWKWSIEAAGKGWNFIRHPRYLPGKKCQELSLRLRV